MRKEVYAKEKANAYAQRARGENRLELSDSEKEQLHARFEEESKDADFKTGLRIKKGNIAHTLNEHEGQAGFDFLGFNIRQYQMGRYKTRTYRGQAGFKTLIRPSRKAIKRHLAHQGNRIDYVNEFKTLSK